MPSPSRPKANPHAGSSALHFDLHDAQLEIFDSSKRFKVVAAGRRFGKSYLAAVTLLIEALKNETDEGRDLSLEEVYYVAPTFEQAKKIMWPLLKALGKMSDAGGVIEQCHEVTAVATLVNGRRISIKGADRPDSLRGVGLSYIVLDEYAFMKPDVWNLVLQPTLAASKGGALFIGTPEGKNHFYDLFSKVQAGKPGFEDWGAWQFESLKNPILSGNEIARQIATMSVAAARQEFGASFNSGGGVHLREEWWKYGPEPSEGDYYIAVDLAGFTAEGSLKKGALKIKDEHSIAVVKANQDGWWVKEIISGRWDVRECALRIVKAYKDYRPIKIGIEKGVLKQAVMPYLGDEQKRLQRYFLVYDLSHGGQKKEDRILWALQGRLEKGRIKLAPEAEDSIGGGWQRKLIEQANDFPSSIAHDDLIDSLAYIDQLADIAYYTEQPENEWEPLDLISGM